MKKLIIRVTFAKITIDIKTVVNENPEPCSFLLSAGVYKSVDFPCPILKNYKFNSKVDLFNLTPLVV